LNITAGHCAHSTRRPIFMSMLSTSRSRPYEGKGRPAEANHPARRRSPQIRCGSGLVALIMFRAILPAISSSSGYW
jgi:hypothetical protein